MLLEGPAETIERRRDGLARRPRAVVARADRHAAAVVGVGGDAQTNYGVVALVARAQESRQARGAPEHEGQDTGRRRVERARVADPPLAEQLAKGLVFIQYRAENLRVVPVFGKGALTVSPRIGHVHITVDDNSWHFVDASGETVILVGLKPGPHSVSFELADPTHMVITSQTVKFVVPDAKGAAHG